MQEVIKEIKTLFNEARDSIEFEFIQVLINYRSIGDKELSTNLHEWFSAIEFYKTLYFSKTDKEKTRVGTLLYSTFFENSDFYNILGSLCKIKLGFKGSSYLFWKTKKYERLLGTGEKKDFLIELLEDAGKEQMISFFLENHFKEIRNSFFHSAYSLSNDDYVLHDSEPIRINEVGHHGFNVEEFLYPKIENVIQFFDAFKETYMNSFNFYKSDKEVDALFPDPCKAIILGSQNGLKGFRIKNSVSYYGKLHDSGVWYDEKLKIWSGHNIRMNFTNIETIEIQDSLTRYENKEDISRSNHELFNVADKIIERNIGVELQRVTALLVKFGDVRKRKMLAESNPLKQKSFVKIIIPFYNKAIEIGDKLLDLSIVKQNIKMLNKFSENE
jgi:hypothetical protein